jgi:hypothetical protein
MFQVWIHSKRHEFVRDIVRDFCFVQEVLEQQFLVFDREERVEFEVLRDVLGVEMNKGLLWRLKDTSHHLFRPKSANVYAGQLLDWCLGYIFHETMKLKEDAYQQQSYGERFCRLEEQMHGKGADHLLGELGNVVAQTRESMRREIARIRFIMAACRRLFLEYLPRHKDNTLLARFLYDRNELVQKVFDQDYAALTNALYGDRPQRMFQLAAQSLDLGGWEREAALARHKALDVGGCASGMNIQDGVEEQRPVQQG